ncbi:hypothetical protein HYC85_004915, partial [Camellia sinensis]
LKEALVKRGLKLLITREIVRLVLIPDGLGPDDDDHQKDALKLLENIQRVMPGHLKDLIEKIGHSEKIRCVIADPTLGWILEAAREMRIEQAAMWPGGTRDLPLLLLKMVEKFWVKPEFFLKFGGPRASIYSGQSGNAFYAAFLTVFSQHQFHELALGLELAGRPFLWNVRPGITNRSFTEYPDGFAKKVVGGGRLLNGHLKSLEHDENKIVSRHEIKNKIENLLSNDDTEANALKLKEIARRALRKVDLLVRI